MPRVPIASEDERKFIVDGIQVEYIQLRYFFIDYSYIIS